MQSLYCSIIFKVNYYNISQACHSHFCAYLIIACDSSQKKNIFSELGPIPSMVVGLAKMFFFFFADLGISCKQFFCVKSKSKGFVKYLHLISVGKTWNVCVHEIPISFAKYLGLHEALQST